MRGIDRTGAPAVPDPSEEILSFLRIVARWKLYCEKLQRGKHLDYDGAHWMASVFPETSTCLISCAYAAC